MSYKVIMPKDPIKDMQSVSKRIILNVTLAIIGLAFSIMGFALGVALEVNGLAGVCLVCIFLLAIGLRQNLKEVP